MTEATLSDIPQHACAETSTALASIQVDIGELGGPSGDVVTDAGVHTFAHNEIAKICMSRCVDGCRLQTLMRAEAAGLEIPTDQQDTLLLEGVMCTLATDMLFSSENDEAVKQPAEIEIPNATGDELREIIERRLGIFKDPELLEKMSGTIQLEGHTPEDIGAMFEELMTPIQPEVYDKLAELVHGDIRSALYIISYLMEVLPLFRSTQPEQMNDAESIRVRGFWPGTPYEISEVDIHRLASLVDDEGRLKLHSNAYVSRSIWLSEDPEKRRFEEFGTGPVIDLAHETLPARITER